MKGCVLWQPLQQNKCTVYDSDVKYSGLVLYMFADDVQVRNRDKKRFIIYNFLQSMYGFAICVTKVYCFATLVTCWK